MTNGNHLIGHHMTSRVSQARIRLLNDRPVSANGEFVLYWMTAARRPAWSHALDRAVDWALDLGKPLLVLEPLRVGYRWAADRHHAFILDGMRANARSFAEGPARYYPYLEPSEGAGRGLLAALAQHAAVVVTDDYPAFFYPRMLVAAARQCPVALEAIDGNGLVPMRLSDRLFTSAAHFRRHLQRVLPDWLDGWPSASPFDGPGAALPHLGDLPKDIVARWPETDLERSNDDLIAGLPIDHAVGPVEQTGGHAAGAAVLDRFLDERLSRYADERNEPGREATSGLSPYLHYGHVAAQEVAARVLEWGRWDPARLPAKVTGARQGWWGLPAPAEAFLDELVTWRELGFNRCANQTDFDRYDTLPDWARDTLADHADDPRPHQYTLAEFEAAATHDPLWNAAQTQLLREGVIHNYLRMLWGKKILEWSATPEDALGIMVELNNKYGLDGRDPNSWSGIMWVLGRFDRGWPERAIYGKIRSMSSRNTARKVDVTPYLERYGATVQQALL